MRAWRLSKGFVLPSPFPSLAAFSPVQVPQLQDKGLLHSRQLTYLISPPLLEVMSIPPDRDGTQLVHAPGHHSVLSSTTPLPSPRRASCLNSPSSFCPRLSRTPVSPFLHICPPARQRQAHADSLPGCLCTEGRPGRAIKNNHQWKVGTVLGNAQKMLTQSRRKRFT